MTTYAATNTGTSGAGSVHQGILAANANPRADSVSLDAALGVTNEHSGRHARSVNAARNVPTFSNGTRPLVHVGSACCK
jgi:hypothetical protein